MVFMPCAKACILLYINTPNITTNTIAIIGSHRITGLSFFILVGDDVLAYDSIHSALLISFLTLGVIVVRLKFLGSRGHWLFHTKDKQATLVGNKKWMPVFNHMVDIRSVIILCLYPLNITHPLSSLTHLCSLVPSSPSYQQNNCPLFLCVEYTPAKNTNITIINIGNGILNFRLLYLYYII